MESPVIQKIAETRELTLKFSYNLFWIFVNGFLASLIYLDSTYGFAIETIQNYFSIKKFWILASLLQTVLWGNVAFRFIQIIILSKKKNTIFINNFYKKLCRIKDDEPGFILDNSLSKKQILTTIKQQQQIKKQQNNSINSFPPSPSSPHSLSPNYSPSNYDNLVKIPTPSSPSPLLNLSLDSSLLNFSNRNNKKVSLENHLNTSLNPRPDINNKLMEDERKFRDFVKEHQELEKKKKNMEQAFLSSLYTQNHLPSSPSSSFSPSSFPQSFSLPPSSPSPYNSFSYPHQSPSDSFSLPPSSLSFSQSFSPSNSYYHPDAIFKNESYNLLLSSFPSTYNLARPAFKNINNDKNNNNLDDPYLQTWRRLGVSAEKVDLWTERLRKYIGQTILKRLIDQIDLTDQSLFAVGLEDVHIGSISLSSLKHLETSKGHMIPQLKLILPFLEMSSNQEYLVARLRELNKGGSISSFKWNGGGEVRGRKWEENLPTDSAILMHIICSYLDNRLPSHPSSLDGRSFSSQHFIKYTEKLDSSHLKDSVYIYESSMNPPHFDIIYHGNQFQLKKGRENVFHALLTFFYFIKTKENGMLRRVSLGMSGINILWIFD